MKKLLGILGVCLLLPTCVWANGPTVARLEVQPGPRTVHGPGKTQQLAVTAHFKDGAVRDVTRLTVFSSADPATATVNENGLIRFKQTGEVIIRCRYLTKTQPILFTYIDPAPGYRWPNPSEVNFIDTHVFAQLKRLNIAPSDLCPDTAFLRRAHLDVCGIMPTPDDVRKFLADPNKNKRADLIDHLLERPEYIDYWTYLWLDALDVELGQLGAKSTTAYRDWIRGHVQKNTPIDRFVRELLTAQGDSGKVGPANFYRTNRTPPEAAEHAATLFLGVRLECFSCHDSYDTPWTTDDYHAFVAFFPQVARKVPTGSIQQREIVSLVMKGAWVHPTTRQLVPAKFFAGERRRFKTDEDRREVLANWLTASHNPFFAKAIVNRIWSKMFGKGIVEPIGDFRPNTPSANDPLLDALAKDLVANRYDVKRLIRTIMNSRTYQLSATPNEHNRTDEKYFSRCIPTKLSDAQIFDGLAVVADVPYPFQGKPAGTRFVQTFGEEIFFSARSIFGRGRLTSCGRDPLPPLQLGGPFQYFEGTFLEKRMHAETSRLTRLTKMKASDKEIFEEFCLAAWSRLPSDNETKTALEYLNKNKNRRHAWDNIAWALVSSREFMRRH